MGPGELDISTDGLRDSNEAQLVSNVRLHELTDQARHAETALRASEDRFRTLFELGPVAVYSCDASGVIREFNRRAAELWGRAPAIGDTDERFCGSFRMIRPDGSVMPHDQCPMADVLTGKLARARDAEVRIERPDGTSVDVVVNIRPLKNQHGEITGAINCFFDITERKRGEQVLRESEERYRTLFDSMDEGYCIIEVLFDDRNGEHKPVDYRFVEVNSAFEKQSGMHDVVGKRMLEFVSNIEDHWLRNYGNVAVTGQPVRFAAEYTGLDRWFEVYAFRVGRPGENKVAVLFADITARKRAEDALRDAKQQAEEANHAKDNFLAVLSHELRTPLTPVLMTTASLKLRDDLPQDLHDDIVMIHRNVELQSRLIDDLLDLSRITSGKLRLSFDVLEINDLVRHACDTCRSNLRERGIDLSCELDADVFDVVGDSGRLQQVVWNLLNNATKFTPEGGKVFVRTENAPGEVVRITVRDTGIGIAPEALERIFGAFEQLGRGESGTTRQFGGMGLGLAICRALVEQHRGSIRAHSDGPGKGSTFVVELPALPHQAAGTTAARPPERQKQPALRVLVVEDHADTAEVMVHLLTKAGHTVQVATSGDEALKQLGRDKFDLVVSDLGLPDMTGYELMKQIKARRPIKGIAMSGYGMEEDVRKSRQAGFSDHLVKPVDFQNLEQSIRRVTAVGASA